MKTLLMNDSSVITMKNAVCDDVEVILKQIIDGNQPTLALSRGTVIETEFEVDPGAARFALCHGDDFMLEALLLLGGGQGRQCWTPFRTWCERLRAEGRAAGRGPLPLVVPDTNPWNCVVLYRACARLDDEQLGELLKIQMMLAQAYVKRFAPCRRSVDATH